MRISKWQYRLNAWYDNRKYRFAWLVLGVSPLLIANFFLASSDVSKNINVVFCALITVLVLCIIALLFAAARIKYLAIRKQLNKKHRMN